MVQPSFASFCDGDSVLLTATSNMTNSKFLWNTNDATNTLLVKVSGEFLVDVKANGCTTRGIANVIAYPIPTVDAGKDLYIMQGDKELIKASASNDVNSFTWTPSTGLDNATILQPEIINPIETTYKLSVSNGHCSNFDTVKIIVLGSFKIPNAFSPNGDGVNDFWEIKGMEKYKTVDVSVFDRYGKKVYETSGYANAWDGTHKGSGTPLPVGVYYYIIDAKRGIPPFIGSVTIIR
jgi:gliding motility-associated-like protein